MFTYDKVKNKPRLLRAMTSLDRAEFEELLKPFQATWEAYVKETSSSDQNRKRQPGGGRRPALLTIADKLLFILYYFKGACLAFKGKNLTLSMTCVLYKHRIWVYNSHSMIDYAQSKGQPGQPQLDSRERAHCRA